MLRLIRVVVSGGEEQGPDRAARAISEPRGAAIWRGPGVARHLRIHQEQIEKPASLPSSVDSDSFFADPDPKFFLNADPDPA